MKIVEEAPGVTTVSPPSGTNIVFHSTVEIFDSIHYNYKTKRLGYQLQTPIQTPQSTQSGHVQPFTYMFEPVTPTAFHSTLSALPITSKK